MSGTQIIAEATIVGIKPNISKTDNYGQTSKGSLDVTLRILQPLPPRKPFPNYAICTNGDPEKPKSRPSTNVKRKKDETDEDFNARQEAAEEQAAYFDEEMAKYKTELERFERDSAALRERLISYAQLAGLAIVFGNQALTVTLTPKEQETLPGFGVSLLPAPDEEGS